MKNYKNSQLILVMLAVMYGTPAAYAQSPAQTKNSAQSSPKSDIRVSSAHVSKGSVEAKVTMACASAVTELSASRDLINSLETENAALRTRLETEQRATKLLDELNATRKSETDALRKALDAKNETIAAKDAVIASQDKLIETLKRKKTSPWKRALDILIGVGVGAVLK